MRGLPPKVLPLRVAVQADAHFVESLAEAADRLILAPVETTLEVSARVSQADVIVVDARSNTAASLRDIRELKYDRPVLAVVNPENVSEALAAGADGVLSGSPTPQAIEAAMYALSAGVAVLSTEILEGFKHPRATQPVETRGATPVDATLTHRENEVIVLMAEGLSNKQIAARLGISEHTAKFHVNSILQKMNAQKRVEAVVRAARLGILSI